MTSNWPNHVALRHPGRDVVEIERSVPDGDSVEEESPSRSELRRTVAGLVLDTTNEGIWLIDSEARTSCVNRRAAELLGYTEEEMIGMHVFQFMDEEQRPLARQSLLRRQRESEQRQELNLRRKDGRAISIIASANPVYDRQGRYAGALALLGDFTLQKETEERLRAQVEDLRKRPSSKKAEGPQNPSGDATQGLSGVPLLAREGLRTAGVLALCGAYVSIVALLTAGGVVSAFLGTATSGDESLEY